MRIVIELKRGELPDVVLNNLYKHTKLQMSYGITLLAIVARPAARAEPAARSSSTSSNSGARSSAAAPSSSCARPRRARTSSKACKIALDHLDAVITLIRGSKNPVEARAGLIDAVRPDARSRRRRSSTCSCSA